MKAVGFNGQVEFDGTRVAIQRKGVMAFFADPMKGAKTIPVTSLTSIEFKPAGRFFGRLHSLCLSRRRRIERRLYVLRG